MAGHRRGGGNPGSQQARAAPPDRVAHRRTTACPGQRRSPHARHRPARLPGAVPADGPRPSRCLVQRPERVACGAARVSDRPAVPGPRCRGVRIPARRDLPPSGSRRLRSVLRDRAHRPELAEHHRPPFLHPRYGALVLGRQWLRRRVPLPHVAGSTRRGRPGLRGTRGRAEQPEWQIRPVGRRRPHPPEPHPASRPWPARGPAPRVHRHCSPDLHTPQPRRRS